MQSIRVKQRDVGRQVESDEPTRAQEKSKHRTRRRTDGPIKQTRAPISTIMHPFNCHEDSAELPWPARMRRPAGSGSNRASDDCFHSRAATPPQDSARRAATPVESRPARPAWKSRLARPGQLLSLCCLIVLVPTINGSHHNQQQFATTSSNTIQGKQAARQISAAISEWMRTLRASVCSSSISESCRVHFRH